MKRTAAHEVSVMLTKMSDQSPANQSANETRLVWLDFGLLSPGQYRFQLYRSGLDWQITASRPCSM